MKISIYLFLLCYVNGETSLPSLNTWFSASSLSMAGGGNLIMLPTSRSTNPANASLQRSFSTSFILYPAGIQAQSVSVLIPKSNSFVIAAINHISYGTFKGYDENAIPTNNYSSSDTWMRLVYSGAYRNFPIRYGISNQVLFSKLENYSLTEFFLSGGFIWQIKKHKTNIGISINDMAIKVRSINKIIKSSPEKYNISIQKELAYLPLIVSIDYLSIKETKNKDYFISGLFMLTKKINFSCGTSTRKIDQDIKENVLKTIMGSSGVGISYKDDDVEIGYGLYFYGTGGWTNGLDLSINF